MQKNDLGTNSVFMLMRRISMMVMIFTCGVVAVPTVFIGAARAILCEHAKNEKRGNYETSEKND